MCKKRKGREGTNIIWLLNCLYLVFCKKVFCLFCLFWLFWLERTSRAGKGARKGRRATAWPARAATCFCQACSSHHQNNYLDLVLTIQIERPARAATCFCFCQACSSHHQIGVWICFWWVFVFVKFNRNISKYWDGTCCHLLLSLLKITPRREIQLTIWEKSSWQSGRNTTQMQSQKYSVHRYYAPTWMILMDFQHPTQYFVSPAVRNRKLHLTLSVTVFGL